METTSTALTRHAPGGGATKGGQPMTDRIELPGTNPPERTGHERIAHIQQRPRVCHGRRACESCRRTSDGTCARTFSNSSRAEAAHWHGTSGVRCPLAARADKGSPASDNAADDTEGSDALTLISRRLLVGFGRCVADSDFLAPGQQLLYLVSAQRRHGIAPLINCRPRYAQGSRQPQWTSKLFDGVFGFHGAKYKHASFLDASIFSKHSSTLTRWP